MKDTAMRNALMFLLLSACQPLPSVACDSEGKPFEDRTNCRLDALERVTLPTLQMQVVELQAQVATLREMGTGKVLHLIAKTGEIGSEDDLGFSITESVAYSPKYGTVLDFTETAIYYYKNAANCTGEFYAQVPGAQRPLSIGPEGTLIKRVLATSGPYNSASRLEYDYAAKKSRCVTTVDHDVGGNPVMDTGIKVTAYSTKEITVQPR